MISPPVHEQAALFALDALPEEERREFLKKVAGDESLAALVAELRDAAALIACDAPACPLPDGAKTRLMARITAERLRSSSPQNGASARRNPAARTKSTGLAALLPWGLAAGFAIFAGILWGERGSDRAAIESEIATQREVSQGLFARVAELETVLAARDSEVARLRGTPPLLASIVWDATAQQGVLKVRGLPAVPDGSDYQLWLIEPGGDTPVSAGVVPIDPDGSANLPFTTETPLGSNPVFFISIEPKGGSPTPEGEVVFGEM